MIRINIVNQSEMCFSLRSLFCCWCCCTSSKLFNVRSCSIRFSPRFVLFLYFFLVCVSSWIEIIWFRLFALHESKIGDWHWQQELMCINVTMKQMRGKKRQGKEESKLTVALETANKSKCIHTHTPKSDRNRKTNGEIISVNVLCAKHIGLQFNFCARHAAIFHIEIFSSFESFSVCVFFA